MTMQDERLKTLPAVDIGYLDDRWLDTSGRIKLMPAEVFSRVPRGDLIYWCYRRARYQLPTKELIEWLREQIGGRRAIELGAGNGDLGFHLGILPTDSYIQQRFDLQAYYRALGQEPTAPKKEVLRMDALSAVKHYKPEVAVAAWLTRKYIDGGEADGTQASIYGPSEEEILDRVDTYIHIGNEAVHGTKTLLSRPHETFRFPWLVSRASKPDLNCIYVWNRSK